VTSILDRLDRLLYPRAAKAVYGGPYLAALQQGPLLSVTNSSPQERMAQFLRAYKVGWFYKAGRKISIDVGGLAFSLSYEDTEGDNADTITAAATSTPFERLDPLEQFLRLMERPNPWQTGRQMFEKTEIRMDFAGSAFWYLEGGSGGGLPTAIYGISPTRMWPSYNKQAELIGWVMDADKPSGGVPFDVDEILPFVNTTATDDAWVGQGVIEAVYAQVPLTDLMARHTSDVLTTGGRLAGMITPKTRSLTENEFQDVVKAWRNVASDPNAARRLLVFPEPMEWSSGAASPKDIGIPELASLTRDEILTAFPLSPYQLGVPMPGGLNSAETRREDRRDYWEGTIHPRVEILEETIQVGLVARYELLIGRPLDFDIEEPDLNDAPTLIEKVGAFKGLVSIGFDPKEAVSAVGLDHIKWQGLPDLLDPVKQAEAAVAAQEATQVSVRDTSNRDSAVTVQQVSGKAYVARATKARDDIAREGAVVVNDFLEGQRERVVAKLRESLPASKKARLGAVKASPEWWDAVLENAELAGALLVIYDGSARTGLQVVADTLGRIVPNKALARVTDDLLTYGGERVADMNAKTLQAITIELAEGTKRGYSVAQLIDGVPSEGFRGVLKVGLDNGVGVWGDARAETIARTETALSYNRATLTGYKEFRVKQVTAIDGDADADCAARNGSTFSVDDAYGIADHPNGTLDWVPVV
jgi:hypothetical protein